MILPLCAASALILAAASIGTSAQVQATAGHLPVGLTIEPVDSFTTTWSPRATLTLNSPNSTWTSSYAQQIWWREPNYGARIRPLALHLADTGYSTVLDPQWSLHLGAQGSAGDVDYFSAQNVLGTFQSALPNGAGVVAANGSAEARLEWMQTTRWRHTLGLRGGISDDYGELDIFSQQVNASASVQSQYALSRRSSVTPAMYASWQLLQSYTFVSVAPSLGYAYQINRVAGVQAAAGAAFAFAGEAIDGGVFEPVSGTLSLGASLVGPTSSSVQWIHSASAAVSPRPDILLRTYVPTLHSAWSSTARFGPKWTLGLNLTLTTNVTPAPQPGDPTETTFRFHAPLTWQFHRHHAVSLTGYVGVRGPHLGSTTGTTRPESSGTLGYSYRFGAGSSSAPSAPDI